MTPSIPLTVDLAWLCDNLHQSRRWFFDKMKSHEFPPADVMHGGKQKWRHDTIHEYLVKQRLLVA
jgi:predicted DNA-binding transcriptional regulator AlpA